MKTLKFLLLTVMVAVTAIGVEAATVTFKFKNPAIVSRLSPSAGSVDPSTPSDNGTYVVTFNNTYSSNIIFTLSENKTVEDITITNDATGQPVESASGTTTVWRVNNGAALQIYSGSQFPDGSSFTIDTGDSDGGTEDPGKSETAVFLQFSDPSVVKNVENDWLTPTATYTPENDILEYDVAKGGVPMLNLNQGYTVNSVIDVTKGSILSPRDYWEPDTTTASQIKLYLAYAITVRKVVNYGDTLLITTEKSQTDVEDPTLEGSVTVATNNPKALSASFETTKYEFGADSTFTFDLSTGNTLNFTASTAFEITKISVDKGTVTFTPDNLPALSVSVDLSAVEDGATLTITTDSVSTEERTVTFTTSDAEKIEKVSDSTGKEYKWTDNEFVYTYTDRYGSISFEATAGYALKFELDTVALAVTAVNNVYTIPNSLLNEGDSITVTAIEKESGDSTVTLSYTFKCTEDMLSFSILDSEETVTAVYADSAYTVSDIPAASTFVIALAEEYQSGYTISSITTAEGAELSVKENECQFSTSLYATNSIFNVVIVKGSEGIHDIISDQNGEKAVYDIYGRPAAEPLSPGLYIIGNKKVIVK